MVGFMKSALNLLGIKKDGDSVESIRLDDFLAALPEYMGYNISFEKKDDPEKGLCFEVGGEEVDSFLGDSSEMLDALSHIGMRVLRKSEGIANSPATEGQEGLRVTFDSKGFRDRKALELKDFAAQQRQKVIDTGGKPAYIPALGPSERKIIHTHLSELGEVLSESIGRGNFKRIRVKLKEDSQYKRAPEPKSAQGFEGGGNNGGHSRGDGQGQNRNQGHGGGGQGRGRRGGGGRNRGRNNDQARRPFGGNGEVNGNSAGFQPNDEDFSHLDDNIGNRLRPGEEPIFGIKANNNETERAPAPRGKAGSDDNFGNR